MRCLIAAVVLVVGACSAGDDAAPPTSGPQEPAPAATSAPRPSDTPPSWDGTAAPNGLPTEAVETTGPAATSGSNSERAAWFVVWVTGRLPDGFADSLKAIPGVEAVSVVRVGNAHVVETRDSSGAVVDLTERGFVIPVELQAIDPDGHRGFVPPEVTVLLEALGPDQVILGSSSTDLRRLDAGSTIILEGGVTLEVSAVVEDRWVGAAEIVTAASDSDLLGTDRDRYAVVAFDGTRDQLAAMVGGLTDLATRVWGEQDVSVFRHADGVQPQVIIKEMFGEFSYRPSEGRRVEIDPEWVERNIVTVALPLIGTVRCHRLFAEMLRGVMEELEALGGEDIITPESNVGCWNPRFIAGRRDLSRHAWGGAADINWGNALDAVRSPVAPALLEVMTAAGITSGHQWINPDPGHFEWIGPGRLAS